MAKKPKKEQFYTPVTVFKYCHLNKPDMGTEQYPKKEGEFSVTVAMDKDDPEVQAFIEKMEGFLPELEELAQREFDSASPKVKAGWKAKKITEPTVMPFYTEEFDADGDPTGRILIKFKTKATFKNKDGEVIKKTVALVDGLGEIIPAKKRPLVYAGTKGRVAFTIGKAFIPGNAEAFLSFYLNQVQIAKLATAGSGTSAFGALEGSDFSADDLEEYDGSSKDDDDDQDDGGNDDFDDEIPF